MSKLLQVLSLVFLFSKKSSYFLVSFYCLLSKRFKPSCCVLLTIINLVFINVNVFGQTTIFRSATTGNWNAAATWEKSLDYGSTWSTSTTVPSNLDGSIVIQNGHTVTANANTTVDEFTVNTGGTIIVNSGITFTIANGAAAIDCQVNGTLRNAGTVTTTGSLAFGATGLYQHNFTTTTGTIPTSTWNTGSTCEIVGYTSTAVTINASFG